MSRVRFMLRIYISQVCWTWIWVWTWRHPAVLPQSHQCLLRQRNRPCVTTLPGTSCLDERLTTAVYAIWRAATPTWWTVYSEGRVDRVTVSLHNCSPRWSLSTHWWTLEINSGLSVPRNRKVSGSHSDSDCKIWIIGMSLRYLWKDYGNGDLLAVMSSFSKAFVNPQVYILSPMFLISKIILIIMYLSSVNKAKIVQNYIANFPVFEVKAADKKC